MFLDEFQKTIIELKDKNNNKLTLGIVSSIKLIKEKK